jgi:hypothetical protein
MVQMDPNEPERALSERPAGYFPKDQTPTAESEVGAEPKVPNQLDSSVDPYLGWSLRFPLSALAAFESQAVNQE